MKKIKINALSLFVAVGFLTSCLQDTEYTDIVDSKGNIPVVSIYGEWQGLHSVAVPISESEKIALPITAARAKTDLTVTVKVNPASFVDDYNAKLESEAIAAGDTLKDGTPVYDPFYMLPDSVFTIPSLTINIPKGTLDGDFEFMVNSTKISLDYNYILPIEIESISGDKNAAIAENFKSVLLFVQIKNKYDGIYTVTGTMIDATSAALTGHYPWRASLVTTAANQVLLYDDEGRLSTAGHIIKSGTSFSSYGEFGLLINFDADGKVSSVENFYGNPSSGRARGAKLDPSGINKYDPIKKTLNIKYWMTEKGANRTSFNETFIFKSARP